MAFFEKKNKKVFIQKTFPKRKCFRNESKIVLVFETFVLLFFFTENARNKDFLGWHAWATITCVIVLHTLIKK